MKNILIIGAGLSSGALIQYVQEKAEEYGWHIIIADGNIESVNLYAQNFPRTRAAWLDVLKANDRRDLINRADLVVSLLPAHLHLEVAHDCIKLNKHLVTSSTVTRELYRLGDEAREKSLAFMSEMGLDPGLENISAMDKIHQITTAGGTIESFRSYSGGLISSDQFNNPWKFILTWNPRNLVLAGQGTAQYILDGKYHYVPYQRLFSEYELVEIAGVGEFEVYANRDSLLNRDIYGLADVPTVFRGTLRYPGFCDSWAALIKIGLTDASYPIIESENLTYYDFLEGFVSRRSVGTTLKERIANQLEVPVNSKVIKNLEWLGLFSRKRVGIANATPALMLEDLLKSKMMINDDALDLVLLQHEFIYKLGSEKRKLTSTLQLKKEQSSHTAMAKFIGLPIGIFVKHIMTGKLSATGVNIPLLPEVYRPVLSELAELGIKFSDKEELL